MSSTREWFSSLGIIGKILVLILAIGGLLFILLFALLLIGLISGPVEDDVNQNVPAEVQNEQQNIEQNVHTFPENQMYRIGQPVIVGEREYIVNSVKKVGILIL